MGKAPEEKWGKMGENGEKWGKMGRKWGGNGGKGDRLHHPSFLIFPHFPPFSPISPPFPPIFPHFPPFFLAMGTLWVRLWVQYPPPEPGTSEPCKQQQQGGSGLVDHTGLIHVTAAFHASAEWLHHHKRLPQRQVIWWGKRHRELDQAVVAVVKQQVMNGGICLKTPSPSCVLSLHKK